MESMSNPINQNIEIPILSTINTEDSSALPQSTIETFTATPSTFRRASVSPPATLPLASAQFLASEINRPASATMASTPATTAHIKNEQREVARSRILARVTEKYPNKPMDFRIRKVNKQMAQMFPDNTPASNGIGGNTSNPSAMATSPSDSTDRKPLPHNTESGAHDMDEERSFQDGKQIPNSTNDSTSREMSQQLQDFPQVARSAARPPPVNGNDANGDAPAEVNIIREIPSYLLRHSSSSPVDKMKLKGIVMGYYKLSDVSNDEDKHAVFGKIDKGGDLFTTVSKETRSGAPVPSQLYLASKVQCSPEKICFEPHLAGLNKAQLKQYVLRRLDVDWSNETEESRKASELQIAHELRNDESLKGQNFPEPKNKKPTVQTGAGTKRGYSAFADDNEDEDEDDDESPLSDIMDFPASDDEDAFVPTGGSKKRKSGRKSITARTSKGAIKDTDGDDIGKGVCIGVWSESIAKEPEDKHAVYSYLDSRGSLWSRVYHVTRDGRFIEQEIPFPRGTVKWDDIILDDHLANMVRDEVKEYVIENRKQSADGSPERDTIKKERKSRKSHAEQAVKQEPYSALRSKTSAVLLGYWKLGLEPDPADKNAVYGYVDTSGRFNLQVRKHTRDNRELTEINPDFPGNGRVQKENMVLEDHLKNLSPSQVQEYTRRALASGVADLVGEELRDAEHRIAAEVALLKPTDGQDKQVPDEPRVKRKYTRRSTLANPTVEASEDGTVDPMSNPQSRALIRDPMGGPHLGYMIPQPYGMQPNGVPPGVPGVAFGPNGSLIFNGTEYHFRAPPQPPIMDESGTTITNNGIQYKQKNNGAFKDKFVHRDQLISVNGEDYVEYRVLVRMDV